MRLGMTVVAEGVEDAETWRLLADAGCQLIQGYALARPAPAADLAALLGRRSDQLVPRVAQPLKLNVRQAARRRRRSATPFGGHQSDFCWRAAGVLRGNECGSAPPRFGMFVTGGSGVWLPPSQ